MATFATLAKTLGDPEKLAAIEKVSNATTDIVGRASKALFDVAGEQSGHISSVIREKAPIKNMYSSLEDEPAEAQKKAFKANVENVQKLTDDPEKLVDTLHEYTKDASTVAPNTMDAMRLGAIKAAMFLKDKIPQPPTPPLPYDKPYEPPFQDQKKFNRYYEAITNPLGILHQLSQNNLQPETKEAVQTVFPSLYGDMQTEILSHVAARGAKMIPYARRMALGKFIGQPLESSMTPSSIQAVQSVSNAAAAKQQAQQQIKPTAKGLEHLSVAQRGATLFQQTSLNKES
jgi:hypothetical protein